MTGWLTKRMTAFRQASTRWTELAEAVESFWEAYFYPAFDSARNVRSIYTADEADQLTIIAELGGYYEQALTEKNRQMSVAMRRIEVHQKETFIPMARTIQRIGVPESAWVPLYYPGADLGFNLGKEYASDACFTEFELFALGVNVNDPSKRLDGSWTLSEGEKLSLEVALTSRGVLEIDATNDPNLLPIIVDRVNQVKPLHIVFDGYRLGFSATIGELILTDFFTSFISDYKMNYTFNANVLKYGDDYQEIPFSWPAMITEGFPVPLYVGFGNGGHIGETAKTEDSSATGLVNELLRIPTFSLIEIDPDTLEAIARLTSSELNGATISEIGFFDSFGHLLAVKNYSPRTKLNGAVLNFRLQFADLTTI